MKNGNGFLGFTAAGETANDGRAGEGVAPAGQEILRREVEGVGEKEPAFGGGDVFFPESGAVGGFCDGGIDVVEFCGRARAMDREQRESAAVFVFDVVRNDS